MIDVIVPFAGNCPHRRRALKWTTAAHTAAGRNVIVGHGDAHRWCKADAVRDALDRSQADTLVLADCDVWVDNLDEAIDAAESAKWVIPHRNICRLNEQGTTDFLDGDRTNLGVSERHRGAKGGGLVILARETYEAIPLDSRFIGWGGEDQCLPAGTEITTRVGLRPIEEIRPGALVLTRDGWKRVLRAGPTGRTRSFVVIEYPLGCVLCTPEHLVLLDGQFAPASSARPGQSLVVSPHLGSTEIPLRGGVVGGTGCPMDVFAMEAATAQTGLAASCSIGPSIAPMSGRLPTMTSCITSTAIAQTTGWPISSGFHQASTRSITESRIGKGSYPGTSLVAASSHERTGGVGPPERSNVKNAAIPSRRSAIALDSAPVVAVSELRVSGETVYNLAVEDTPEFFANGVLVHNSWGYALQTLLGSPTRLKAPLYHLWHPPAERRSRSRGSYENQMLLARYFDRHNEGDVDGMRALIGEAREHRGLLHHAGHNHQSGRSD